MPPAPLPQGLQSAISLGLLACPRCKGTLGIRGKSLVCAQSHCFDVARQGHVHLAPGKKSPEAYDRGLMEARSSIVAQGFFAPLTSWCSELLGSLPGPHHILDAGCGEGSFLEGLCQHMPPGTAGVGIDLSADGIRLAAGRYKRHAWCVADLADIPAPGRSFSAVLNVLSPANYGEFARILAPGGTIVKAIPTSRHLQEIRAALHANEEFSNQRVVDHFRSFFPAARTTLLEHVLECSQQNASAFLGMTPLGWSASPESRLAFESAPPSQVTISLEVVWGRLP